MKKLLIGVVTFCAFQNAWADHAQLETLSGRLTRSASDLNYGARQVIGYYPSPRQRYAYEHVQFLYSSARRFEHIVHQQDLADDHQHDQMIRDAYRRLNHDVYYARQTFHDLFYYNEGADEHSGRDHAAYYRLNALLTDCEYLVRQISYNLPHFE